MTCRYHLACVLRGVLGDVFLTATITAHSQCGRRDDRWPQRAQPVQRARDEPVRLVVAGVVRVCGCAQRVGRARAEKDACAACAGWKLVICDRCDGSMRWRMTDEKTGAVLGERRCPWCNEVGMRECEACVPAFARTSGRGGSRGGR